MKLTILLVCLAAIATPSLAASPPKPKTVPPIAQTAASGPAVAATAPWHLGVYYEHDGYRGVGLNGAGVRFGRDLFSHFGLEGNLTGSVRNSLVFAFVGGANQVVFSPGSLDRVSANLLGYAFADLGPLRVTAEAGPALEHLVYQGVSGANYGAFCYGLGLGAYTRGGWGVRVQGGEEIFSPVKGAGHSHIWSVSVGPSFRW